MKNAMIFSTLIIAAFLSFQMIAVLTSVKIIPSGENPNQSIIMLGDAHHISWEHSAKQIKEKIIPCVKAAEPAAGEKARTVFYIGIEHALGDPRTFNELWEIIDHLFPEVQKLSLQNTKIEDVEIRKTMARAIEILDTPHTVKRGLREARNPEFRKLPDFESYMLNSTFIKNGIQLFVDEMTFQDALDEFEQQCSKIKHDIDVLSEKERVYLNEYIEKNARFQLYGSTNNWNGFRESMKKFGIRLSEKMLTVAWEAMEKKELEKLKLLHDSLRAGARFLFDVALYSKVRTVQKTSVEKIVIVAGRGHTDRVSKMFDDMGFPKGHFYGDEKCHSIRLPLPYLDLLSKPAAILNAARIKFPFESSDDENEQPWHHSLKGWIIGLYGDVKRLAQ